MTHEAIDGLVCPASHEPLRLATETELRALRTRIARGEARRRDDEPIPSFDGAYLTPGLTQAYLVIEGIPHLLVETRVDLDQALTVDPEPSR